MNELPITYPRINPGNKKLDPGENLLIQLSRYLDGAKPDIENKNLIRDINVLYIISNNERLKAQFPALIKALNKSLEKRTQYTLLDVVKFLNENKDKVKSAGIELEKEVSSKFYYLLTSTFIVVSLAGTVLALHLFQNQLLTMLTLGAMVANPATPFILGAVLLVAVIGLAIYGFSYYKLNSELKKQHFKYVDPAPTPDTQETSDDLASNIDYAANQLGYEFSTIHALFKSSNDIDPKPVLKIEGSEEEERFLKQMNAQIKHNLGFKEITKKNVDKEVKKIYERLMGKKPEATTSNEAKLLEIYSTYKYQAFDAYDHLLDNIPESLANDEVYQSTLKEFKTIYPVFFAEQESSSSNSKPLLVVDEEQRSQTSNSQLLGDFVDSGYFRDSVDYDYFGDKAVSSRAEARGVRLHQTIIKARLTRLNLLKLILPTVDFEKTSQAEIKTMLDEKLEQMTTMMESTPESLPDTMLGISQIVLKERENLVKMIAEKALASTKTPDEETLSSIEDKLKETKYAALLGEDVNENLLNVSKTYFKAKFDDRASFYAEQILSGIRSGKLKHFTYGVVEAVTQMDSDLRELTFKHLDEKLKKYAGKKDPDVLKHRINALKDHMNGEPRDIKKEPEGYKDMRNALSKLKINTFEGSCLFSGNPSKDHHGPSKGPSKKR